LKILVFPVGARLPQGPRFRNGSALLEVVDDQYQLVIMVAVEDLNVDAGLRHPLRQLTELPWLSLIQSLNQNVTLFDDLNAGSFQRLAGSGPICEEEVGHTLAINDERAAALNAYSGAAQGVAHLGQCAGTVFKRDG
jgi:hypothetical protein